MSTVGISISLDTDVIEEIRARVGKRGLSAYLDTAARRQLERDKLDELITWGEEVNGPVAPEAVATKAAILRGEA